MSAYVHHAPDGATIVLRRGARVAWANPGGLGGTHLTGVVVGVSTNASGRCLHVVGVDADPSPSLRAARDYLRAHAPRLPACWMPPRVHAPRSLDGISGEGGLVLFTGDGALRAIDHGDLVVAPPTVRTYLRALRVLVPRWLRSTRYRLVDRLWGWVERGIVDAVMRLGPDEEGARRRVVGWLIGVQARRRQARELWWRSS